MAKRPRNLNDKPKEYIEKNFLELEPEGLPIEKVPNGNDLVMNSSIPKMKKITFHNGRDPGHELMFHYASKTHPLKHYTLFHGKEHTIPEEVIDHLESCAEAQYGYRAGPNGHPQMYNKPPKLLYRCQPARA